jgi:hypothetical protein
MTDYEIYSDPFLSLYQSAVTEVGKRLDERVASPQYSTFRERVGLERSAASLARAHATEIAKRDTRRLSA